MKEWEDLTLETAERFGGNLPHPDTTKAIGTVYARAPQAVTRAIDRVAHDYDQGTVRSPWGILKSRVQQLADDTPKHEASNDRDKAVERAEQWIRTAGLMYDRPSEIEHELFGDTRVNPETDKDGAPIPASGQPPLTGYQDDNPLRNRLLELWASHRPAGEQTEQDAIDRGLKHQADRAALPPPRKPIVEPDNRPLEIKDGIRIP